MRFSNIAIVVLVVGASADAWSYPQFQFSSGNSTCNLCHYAPAGGGMLTAWGRDESADSLSMGGNGEFLHGYVTLPDWIELGGDLRVAALVNDVGSPDGAELAVFPMQAELSARIAAGKWSIVGNLGLRGSVRRPDVPTDSTREQGSTLSAFISKEHYAQWDISSKLYARVGRFYAPFGLRLHDHTTYVRRYQGFNLFQETYGLSGGYVSGNSEYHVTAFVSDELRWSPQRQFGGTAMAEWRTGDVGLGASSRLAFADHETTVTAGSHGKWWLEGAKILLMVEVGAAYQRFADTGGESRFQLTTYLGPVWFPVQGLSVGGAYELFDEDLLVRNVERHAAGTWLSFMPRSHFEVMLSGRYQFIGSSERAFMSLLQVHYYL